MAATSVDIINPTEPVSSDFIKTHMRIDTTNEDDNIDKFIKWARKAVEKDSNITLVEKSVKMQFEKSADKYYLKFDTQESGVTSMYYTDSAGVVTAVTDSVLHNNSLPNYVIADIPSTATNVKIEYLATPQPDHPITAAVVEKLVMLFSYNVKVKKEAAVAYKEIIDSMGVKFFN
jgi:hypothetical protein